MSDLTFARAPSDRGYQRIHWEERYRIPVDVAVIGVLLLAGLVAVIVWRIRVSGPDRSRG